MSTRSISIFPLLAFLSLILGYTGQVMAFDAKSFWINSPSFKEEVYEGFRYRLSKPNDYVPDSNKNKKYPLVVYLHDAGGRGADNRKQSIGLTYLGNGFSANAQAFQNRYPSFVFVPQCPLDMSWQGNILDRVIQTIEHLKSSYPIDTNRIYLIGYSMGGSGSYELAGKYYDFNGQLFAGIIRIAGQSSFDNEIHKIISKSSVWIHIGLQDTELRIEKAREAYAMQKEIHDNALERIAIIDLNGKQGKTSSLIINGRKKVKITEYYDFGHGINLLPFDNPAVLEWLFEQKIT